MNLQNLKLVISNSILKYRKLLSTFQKNNIYIFLNRKKNLHHNLPYKENEAEVEKEKKGKRKMI
jgi:hypothetical protein